MLKRIYNNYILHVFKKIDRLKTYIFPKRYELKIEKIVYSENTYHLILRIIDQTNSMNLSINQIFCNKMLIDRMSPIDAYICGIIYSLDKYSLIFHNASNLINYFNLYNHGYVVDETLDLIDINFYAGKVKIKAGKFIRNIEYNELALQPYLLNGLKSWQTAKLGAISLEYNVDKLCLNS